MASVFIYEAETANKDIIDLPCQQILARKVTRNLLSHNGELFKIRCHHWAVKNQLAWLLSRPLFLWVTREVGQRSWKTIASVTWVFNLEQCHREPVLSLASLETKVIWDVRPAHINLDSKHGRTRPCDLEPRGVDWWSQKQQGCEMRSSYAEGLRWCRGHILWPGDSAENTADLLPEPRHENLYDTPGKHWTDVQPMLVEYWADIADGGPTFHQHRLNDFLYHIRKLH